MKRRKRFHPVRGDMFIDRGARLLPAPFGGAEIQLERSCPGTISAPPNGVGSGLCASVHKHLTPNGVK
jgi:hypothetical protein